MMNNQLKIDKYFLISVALLAFGGFFIFASASLGLLARDSSIFQSVALKQMINLILGITAFIIMSKIHYKNLKKYAFYIFLSSIILNLHSYILLYQLYFGTPIDVVSNSISSKLSF